jgi:type II secretory pathway component PulC
MGIQNGDTLVTLNGISLASGTPDALLDAVSDSTAFELVVLRRGEVVRLRYVVLG